MEAFLARKTARQAGTSVAAALTPADQAFERPDGVTARSVHWHLRHRDFTPFTPAETQDLKQVVLRHAAPWLPGDRTLSDQLAADVATVISDIVSEGCDVIRGRDDWVVRLMIGAALFAGKKGSLVAKEQERLHVSDERTGALSVPGS